MGLLCRGQLFVKRSPQGGGLVAEHVACGHLRPADASGRAGRQEVAVVRHPIADARNVVVGYELRFGGSIDLGDPSMDAKATSALLVEAFGDIGLETLAGRHPAWVTIARNFLVEIGPPPVRPDRAVLQIKAYHARDDLLADPAEALAQRLHHRARRVGRRDGHQRRGAHVALLDRARGRLQALDRRSPPRPARAQDAGRPARGHRGRRLRRLRALQGPRLHLLPGRVLRPAAHLQAPRRRHLRPRRAAPARRARRR